VSDILFTKYKKADGATRVLLMYLILNNYDLDKIEAVEEITQEFMFGIKLKKIYGVTSEFVDTAKIDKELASIQIPVVCSFQSFEMYTNEETIYLYTPKQKDKPLYINDMGVISPLMVIDNNYVISSNQGLPVELSENKGFMYFVDYVLKGHMQIGSWEAEYRDKEFYIYYISEKNGKPRKECLYHAQELDRTSTYKLVLYIIRKVIPFMEEYPPDNFEKTIWELEKNKYV